MLYHGAAFSFFRLLYSWTSSSSTIEGGGTAALVLTFCTCSPSSVIYVFAKWRFLALKPTLRHPAVCLVEFCSLVSDVGFSLTRETLVKTFFCLGRPDSAVAGDKLDSSVFDVKVDF